jgi:hypothetical protein
MKLYLLGGTLLICLTTTPAFAYIDPGTGSLWIQTMIAFAAGSLITVKMYWQRFKQFLFGKKTEKKENLLEENNPTNQGE